MDDLEKWRKAGKIAAEALMFGKKLIKPGAKLIDIADAIDKKIVELGAQPAWPTQLSLNEVAAHATPEPNDETILTEQIVCLDVGAHIDGCVGDTACTVDLSGKHEKLVEAVKEALRNAIKTVKVGVEIREIGKAIEETIKKHNFQPIKNLSGHGINQWEIHDEPSIPNYDNGNKTVLEKGQIIAIEPFATTGGGTVDEAERGNIFSFIAPKPVRSPFARDILAHVAQNYKNLPFTTRWLTKIFGTAKTSLGLKELLQAGALHAHPPLFEVSKGMVSVYEKTLLVDDAVEVLTPYDEDN
ncbi:type II methionyl aminopeptidase [Candidatus Woesearchaeota archaeon]|nr:type II methionyl aminopeptidase [Candidatus Woesearchaeota archaeon]